MQTNNSNKDYRWYAKQDFCDYAGKWIAIFKQKVIANHSDLSTLIKEVTKKFKLSEISLTHVPEKDTTLIY